MPWLLSRAGQRLVDDFRRGRNGQARAEVGVPLLAIRFSEDRTSPQARFETLRQVFGGTPEVVREDGEMCWQRGMALETIEINSRPGNPYGISPRAHPVLTLELRQTGHPTPEVFNRVLEFLQDQTTRANVS